VAGLGRPLGCDANAGLHVLEVSLMVSSRPMYLHTKSRSTDEGTIVRPAPGWYHLGVELERLLDPAVLRVHAYTTISTVHVIGLCRASTAATANSSMHRPRSDHVAVDSQGRVVGPGALSDEVQPLAPHLSSSFVVFKRFSPKFRVATTAAVLTDLVSTASLTGHRRKHKTPATLPNMHIFKE
jgi:hypothetical protein